MKKYPKIGCEVYTCERCKGDPWVQRPKVRKGGKIELTRPNNCTHCKSPSWQIPRS